ncbi:glycosyltransferase family 2 protein [Blastochloris sulfoviridis]|nr:glycosyltransferase [Blastochloris sulfoviridis]
MTARRRRPPTEQPAGFDTAFVRDGAATFAGHAFDPADPARRLVLDILVDGVGFATLRADRFVPHLAARGLGDGCCGFALDLDREVLATAGMVEARIANTGAPVGAPIALDAAPAANDSAPRGAGQIRWAGGLRFQGWVAGEADGVCVDILVNGERIDRVAATGWGESGADPDDARLTRTFDVHLPARFADGRVRRVTAVHENGTTLEGSPAAFVAFADGLARTLEALGDLDSERLRGEMFDRLMPASWPMAGLADWRTRFSPPEPCAIDVEIAVVMVGPGDAEKTQASLERQRHAAWVAAAMPAAEAQAQFDPALVHDLLADDAADSELVLFCLAGTRLDDFALARIADAFAAFPDADAAYGDFDLADDDGRPWPVVLPAFDNERLLEQGYGAHLFALHRDVALDALEAGAANLYALALFAAGQNGDSAKTVHIPGSLGEVPQIARHTAEPLLAAATKAHLEAQGIDAQVQRAHGVLLPAVAVRRARPEGRVTLAVPSRNRGRMLRRAALSLRAGLDAVGGDLIIVDNDSTDTETLSLLAELEGEGAHVLRVPGPFGWAHLVNRAAATTKTEFLCVADDAVEAADDRWLDEMLRRMADPGIAAVGPLLLSPGGLVRHAGCVLGPGFDVADAFRGQLGTDAGYGDLLKVAHEVSALSASCLLTRRAAFEAVGGMDESRFPRVYPTVDYCLKLRAQGGRIVLTPRARLIDHRTEGRDTTPGSVLAPQHAREQRALRARWGEALVADPCYSPLLGLDGTPFSALAWPPRSFAPRLNFSPPPVAVPPGW